MRLVVIGGVSSTRIVVEKLSQHGFSDVFVFGYLPTETSLVSGWSDLEEPATEAGYNYIPFRKVAECQKLLEEIAPDHVFAVGLSQIIPKDILAIAPKKFIGFHPTRLPRGRGRAPLAWLILDQVDGAATFFVMNEGVDDGPILAQVPFNVEIEDDALSVEKKLLTAEALALDNLLPALASGTISRSYQDHSLATYYGKRAPEDGWLDWQSSSDNLLKLIRASAPPHPGSYTYDQDTKIVVLRAESGDFTKLKGVVGRILSVGVDGSFFVQCGEGCLSILAWTAPLSWKPVIGRKLGFYCENEVHMMRGKISALEARLSQVIDLLHLPDFDASS